MVLDDYLVDEDNEVGGLVDGLIGGCEDDEVGGLVGGCDDLVGGFVGGGGGVVSLIFLKQLIFIS
jgi:hypothetical protein